MAVRFLPADDPVLEEVLNWTVTRDARLGAFSNGCHSHAHQRKASTLARVHELLGEVELSLNGLVSMH